MLEDNTGWVSVDGEWTPLPGSPPPVKQDPTHRYYLRPLGLSLNLRLDGAWLRCVDCGRIQPEALADVCPGCLGELVEADPDYLSARTGFCKPLHQGREFGRGLLGVHAQFRDYEALRGRALLQARQR
jgi:hypothetical protein